MSRLQANAKTDKLYQKLIIVFLGSILLLLTGCSGETEYVLLDSFGRDTGHRVYMTEKSDGNVMSRIIVQMDYEKEPTDYFKVPFIWKKKSSQFFAIEKTNKVPIDLMYGGYEKKSELFGSLGIHMNVGIPNNIQENHIVNQIFDKHPEAIKKSYFGKLIWGIKYSTGNMFSPHNNNFLIPIKYVPKSILKTPDPIAGYTAYLPVLKKKLKEKQEKAAKQGEDILFEIERKYKKTTTVEECMNKVIKHLQKFPNIIYGIYPLKNRKDRFLLQVHNSVDFRLSDMSKLWIIDDHNFEGERGFPFKNGGARININANSVIGESSIAEKLNLSNESHIQKIWQGKGYTIWLSTVDCPDKIINTKNYASLKTYLKTKLWGGNPFNYQIRGIQFVEKRYNEN